MGTRKGGEGDRNGLMNLTVRALLFLRAVERGKKTPFRGGKERRVDSLLPK